MTSYNQLVEDYFFNAKMTGELDCSKPLTVNYRAGTVQRGLFFELYLEGNAAGIIVAARFKAYGSPYLIAGVEWLCRKLQGSSFVNAQPLNAKELAQQLDLPKKQQSVVLLIEESCANALKLLKEKAGVANE